jgi:hypothetical protein
MARRIRIAPGLVLPAILLLATFGFSAAAEGHECKCRANGQEFAQGQVLCIMAKLQRCEMFLNNSSWKVIADSCPQTLLLLPKPQRPELPHSSRPLS